MSYTKVEQQSVTVLGSTGSIGVSTLDVIARHPELFSVFALTANTNLDLLVQQCLQFKPRYAVLPNDRLVPLLLDKLAKASATSLVTEVLCGQQALQDVAAATDVDSVMAAIVGAAGLLPTMAAVRAGKKVLLANKESLVMAGSLFTEAVIASKATLLPIDSEHNAIYQCLPINYTESDSASSARQQLRKILLTGSGGPLRTWSVDDIRAATPEQACNHPNWSMGRKISVDSASLMNKGLEFIEARWLFDVAPSLIDIVIHPQSIIHSMVEYVDGSVLAQLGNPDMRTPIAYSLAYPERIESGVSSLDMIATAQLDFEAPDTKRFPALSLAINAAESGTGAAAILNAANEVAVAAFLDESINFGQMVDMLTKVMNSATWEEPKNFDDVLDLDRYSRQITQQFIAVL